MGPDKSTDLRRSPLSFRKTFGLHLVIHADLYLSGRCRCPKRMPALSFMNAFSNLMGRTKFIRRAPIPVRAWELFCSGFCIRCLRESDIHLTEHVFASNRQVCDEKKLLPAFLHIGFYPILCSPGLFHNDDSDWRIGCTERTR